MFNSRLALKWLVAPAALVAVAAFSLDAADARPGSGRSVGSRGSNTYSAPPATATAPKPAAPITKSMTQPGAATAATAGTAAAASASRFGAGSLMKGLLLGGLMGAAFAGIFGGGALASMLGFLVQTALIVGAVMLIVSFFRRKSQGPAMATAAASAGPTQQRLDQQLNRTSAGPMGSGPAPLAITGDDFSTFERMLGDIQTAYGRNDQRALGDNMTPEMLSYFVEELTEDSKRGCTNEIANVKLLQG